MPIAGKTAEASPVPCKTSKMKLFAKIINDYKGEFKPCQTSQMGLFPQVVID